MFVQFFTLNFTTTIISPSPKQIYVGFLPFRIYRNKFRISLHGKYSQHFWISPSLANTAYIIWISPSLAYTAKLVGFPLAAANILDFSLRGIYSQIIWVSPGCRRFSLVWTSPFCFCKYNLIYKSYNQIQYVFSYFPKPNQLHKQYRLDRTRNNLPISFPLTPPNLQTNI